MSRDYAKMDSEELGILMKGFQADSRRMRLLQILDKQLELFIATGKPDLRLFFTSLKEETLLPEEEHSELMHKFHLDAVG